MATEQFSQFVGASVKHLDGIIGMKFSSYGEDVPDDTRKVDELIDEQKKDQSVMRQAAHQQAIDIIQAANRAVAVRKMTHKDYIAAYQASAIDRKAYLQRREKNHRNGAL